MVFRQIFRVAAVAAVAMLASAYAPTTESAAPVVTVFKDANCGCCSEWVEHLRAHAFTVVARDTSNVGAVKQTARVPEQLHSCHTAFVSGYVVEGHVPAADIQRMLRDKPRIAGIAVRGMPIGSPGMEMPGRKDKYDVVAFQRDGSTSVYARH